MRRLTRHASRCTDHRADGGKFSRHHWERGLEGLDCGRGTECPGAAPAMPTLALAVPGRGEALPDVRRSDHAAFWDEGYPAVMLTDTANFRNPHYHLPSTRSTRWISASSKR